MATTGWRGGPRGRGGRRAVLGALALAGAAGACDGSSTGPPPPPTLVSVALAPRDVSVPPGGTVQFQVTGRMSDGSSQTPAVDFRASGGEITSSGLLYAPAAPGTYRVAASALGSPLGDSTTVAVPAPGYATVAGADWRSYAGREELRAAQLFYWLDPRDVHQFVELVPDRVFGQVARITFPANTGSSGSSPRISRSLPAPLDRMWFRWRVRFEPGWTSAGPDPAGWANSYKLAFWGWSGFDGRGEVEYTNTTDYFTSVAVLDSRSGQWLQYRESLLPGSAPNFGAETTEWSDGEWWEFVVRYEKTGPASATQSYWRRRLTRGGHVVDDPWTFHGVALSGAETPRVDRVELGINRNKNNPTTMYLYWGPWEVVDGSRYSNPFGVPGV